MTLLTSVPTPEAASSRATRSARSNPPGTATTVAPCTWAWSNLPAATPPSGTTTTVRRPKRPPYAAADALVFPVEAQSSVRLPSWSARATATTMPRSLNDPVGLRPSSLKWSEPRPSAGPRVRDATQGVPPSPRLMRGVPASSGSHSA